LLSPKVKPGTNSADLNTRKTVSKLAVYPAEEQKFEEIFTLENSVEPMLRALAASEIRWFSNFRM
jgi:hypothetical protein